MSQSVTLRIPDELLARVDHIAKQHGMTRTAAIVNSLWVGTDAPGAHQAPPPPIKRPGPSGLKRTKPVVDAILAKNPLVRPASSLPTPVGDRYQRPAHDANCKCGICSLR